MNPSCEGSTSFIRYNTLLQTKSFFTATMSLWTVRSEWPFYWYFHRLFSAKGFSGHEKPSCHKNNFQYLPCIKIFHLIISRFYRHFLLRKCCYECRLIQHFCFSALYIFRWYKSQNFCQYHKSMSCFYWWKIGNQYSNIGNFLSISSFLCMTLLSHSFL